MATSQPLKSTADLDRVRDALTNNRDRALFEFGVNTAFRGGDALSLRVKDAQDLKAGDDIVIREQKTKNAKKAPRRVTLNALVAQALAAHAADRIAMGASPDDWLFVSQSGMRSSKGAALSIVSLTRLWQKWCKDAGIEGQFGSHTGRKSLGYLSRVEDGIGIEVLQKMYGHSAPRTTLTYVCVQDEELKAIYMKERTAR